MTPASIAARFFAQDEHALIQQELGFVILLAIAALVAVFVRRVRLPYTVALVVVGLVLAFFPDYLQLEISSELILAILVPPLIFEATLQIKWNRLQSDLLPILLLALLGTLLSTLMIGGIVNKVLGIPVPAAIAFGALISATDPVAVIGLFRTLGVSKRLAVLVEGESLFNDGVAIVLFNLAVVMATTSTDVTFQAAFLEFLRVSLGGLALGAGMGFLVSYVVLKNVDDHLIETATTLALAFGSFVVTEQLHLSGILAVVAAGLIVGNLGTRNTSPTTRMAIDNFWELLAFIVNSIVFLVIGLQIELDEFQPYLVPVLVAVLAVLASRILVVYGILGGHGQLSRERTLPVTYRHVMFWGGLRGAISLALALTLPLHLAPELASELQVMTFGVVLFTLLVQGTTIERVIKSLGMGTRSEIAVGRERRHAVLFAKTAGMREIDRLQQEGILFRDVADVVREIYEDEMTGLKEDYLGFLQRFPELEQELVILARQHVLRAERTALSEAARRGLIDEEVHEQLSREANERLAALNRIRASRGEVGDE